MSKRIKGITIELDGETKGLDKALQDVNKRSRDVNKELRDVDRLLKFNPGNTELIAQKQKLLGDQVETTRDKLDQLKEAESEVQRQFEDGEIGEEQYRNFQRELVETESKLKHFESQLEKSQSKWDDLSKKVTEAGDKLQDSGKKVSGTGKTMTKWVTGPIAAGAAGLVGLATASGQAADRILDLNQITGLSTDSIQEWQHVATVAGVEGEAMTSAVEGLVRRIPQLEDEGGKATEALEKLGISFSDLEDMSPDEQIDTMMNKLAEMEDPLDRNAVGSQLFGGAWKEIAPILGMGADGMAEARDEAHDLGRVMGEDSLNDANDFRVEMDKLIGMLKSAALQIGADLAPILKDTLGPIIQDTVVPAIQDLAENVKGVIEWFMDLSPQMQKVILGAIGLAAALGPLLMVLGSMMTGLGGILKLVPTLITSIMALGKAFMFLAMNPVGLIITAIAALVAIGIAVWQNWETISEKAVEIWGAIAEWFSEFWENTKEMFSDAVQAVADFVQNGFQKVEETIEKFLSAGSDFIDDTLSNIRSFFGSALDWIDDKTGGKFKSVTDTIRKYLDMALGVVEDVWSFIEDSFRNSLDFVSALLEGDFEGMWDAVKNQMDNIWETIKEIWDRVMDFFGDIDLFDIGRDIIDGMIGGIKSMAGNLVDAAKGVVDGAIDGAKNLLGIASPSKVFREIGEWSGEGLEQGLRAMGGRVQRAGERLAENSVPEEPDPTGGQGTVTNINMNGLFNGANFHVRSDQDIEDIAKRLHDYMKQKARSQGVVY